MDNTTIVPAGYGQGYERPLISVSDSELLNPSKALDQMNEVELCDFRNELVARRYSLFNNDMKALTSAIKPYAEMYKNKFI